MDIGNWISVFMALIATASVVVTYAVFRSSTDPVVIVYADPDIKRPSFVNLIIKNIGNGAAHSIQFNPNRPLPYEAFSIEVPEKMPASMEVGPIVTGIPFLAPGQKITLTWGQYGGLYKYIGDEPIQVESQYYAVGNPKFYSRRLSATSSLDIRTFERSESAEHGYGPNLVKEFKALNQSVVSATKGIQQIADRDKS
ncbi:hypothetical protein [Pseudoalteromonas sp. SG44-8]|uniref:hypothetical protein n=1 Tax=Pseudoalteromonas sp. SG44-8 TaxID=2760958 RepID=UPI001603756E|nr:hypothetical protein [Pseudoalteromonas sp. SG44-8]MBB1397246.1 hypothetical protein [Pseudoalteromonas sp. SG44-8]